MWELLLAQLRMDIECTTPVNMMTVVVAFVRVGVCWPDTIIMDIVE